jgi:hypothetical protein
MDSTLFVKIAYIDRSRHLEEDDPKKTCSCVYIQTGLYNTYVYRLVCVYRNVLTTHRGNVVPPVCTNRPVCLIFMCINWSVRVRTKIFYLLIEAM